VIDRGWRSRSPRSSDALAGGVQAVHLIDRDAAQRDLRAVHRSGCRTIVRAEPDAAGAGHTARAAPRSSISSARATSGTQAELASCCTRVGSTSRRRRVARSRAPPGPPCLAARRRTGVRARGFRAHRGGARAARAQWRTRRRIKDACGDGPGPHAARRGARDRALVDQARLDTVIGTIAGDDRFFVVPARRVTAKQLRGAREAVPARALITRGGTGSRGGSTGRGRFAR